MISEEVMNVLNGLGFLYSGLLSSVNNNTRYGVSLVSEGVAYCYILTDYRNGLFGLSTTVDYTIETTIIFDTVAILHNEENNSLLFSQNGVIVSIITIE